MLPFPYNNQSDEYIYPPAKRTINSFKTDEELKCLSPFGPVSNMNCPKDTPNCNCPSAVNQLEPYDPEPTDADLAASKNATSECDYILSELGDVEWLGIDFNNPHSTYNCNYCAEKYPDSSTTDIPYEDVKGAPSSWKKYFKPTSESAEYYFNYDKRKTYDGDAYPPSLSSSTTDPSGECDKIIGDYFKYYKEYSNTAATFWNTPAKTPLLRKAQTTLMMAQRIKILVHGDITAKPGRLIYVDYPNFGGRWMIYKVQRVITPQKHSMYLYLMRDGVQ